MTWLIILIIWIITLLFTWYINLDTILDNRKSERIVALLLFDAIIISMAVITWLIISDNTLYQMP